MKKILSFTLLVLALFFGFERVSETQTKPGQAQPEEDKNRPQLVALKSGEPAELTYDVRGLLPPAEDAPEKVAISEKENLIYFFIRRIF